MLRVKRLPNLLHAPAEVPLFCRSVKRPAARDKHKRRASEETRRRESVAEQDELAYRGRMIALGKTAG